MLSVRNLSAGYGPIEVIRAVAASGRVADAVWAELTRDGTLDWCRGLKITWLSPRPFGVGTKRQARLLGVLRVQEEYFIWEEGRRMAFFVTAVRPADPR